MPQPYSLMDFLQNRQDMRDQRQAAPLLPQVPSMAPNQQAGAFMGMGGPLGRLGLGNPQGNLFLQGLQQLGRAWNGSDYVLPQPNVVPDAGTLRTFSALRY